MGGELSAEIQIEILDTLSRLHEMGILHNDATTSNWMFKNGVMRLIDFGDSEINDNINDNDKLVELNMLYLSLKYSCKKSDNEMQLILDEFHQHELLAIMNECWRTQKIPRNGSMPT